MSSLPPSISSSMRKRRASIDSRPAEAEEQVLAYIRQHCPDGSRPPLAGTVP